MTNISNQSVLHEFRQESCLDVRKLAALHGVDARNETLCRAILDLERSGKIRRIRGKGRNTSFVLATFET